MENNNIPKPQRGSEITLGDVGRKYVTGAKLTMTEENMAMLASASERATNYGPDPAEFTVKRPDIPETVKGSLVEHSS